MKKEIVYGTTRKPSIPTVGWGKKAPKKPVMLSFKMICRTKTEACTARCEMKKALAGMGIKQQEYQIKIEEICTTEQV